MHPAARSGGAHAEAGEQRSAETEPEQQHVDDLRRMLLGRADPQPGDLERVVERGQRRSAGRPEVLLRAGRDRRVPELVLRVANCTSAGTAGASAW